MIDISRNEFTGEIPAAIGSLSGLQVVYLKDNNLIGSVPDMLCEFTAGADNNIVVWSDCLMEVECSCCAKCF